MWSKANQLRSAVSSSFPQFPRFSLNGGLSFSGGRDRSSHSHPRLPRKRSRPALSPRIDFYGFQDKFSQVASAFPKPFRSTFSRGIDTSGLRDKFSHFTMPKWSPPSRREVFDACNDFSQATATSIGNIYDRCSAFASRLGKQTSSTGYSTNVSTGFDQSHTNRRFTSPWKRVRSSKRHPITSLAFPSTASRSVQNYNLPPGVVDLSGTDDSDDAYSIIEDAPDVPDTLDAEIETDEVIENSYADSTHEEARIRMLQDEIAQYAKGPGRVENHHPQTIHDIDEDSPVSSAFTSPTNLPGNLPLLSTVSPITSTTDLPTSNLPTPSTSSDYDPLASVYEFYKIARPSDPGVLTASTELNLRKQATQSRLSDHENDEREEYDGDLAWWARWNADDEERKEIEFEEAWQAWQSKMSAFEADRERKRREVEEARERRARELEEERERKEFEEEQERRTRDIATVRALLSRSLMRGDESRDDWVAATRGKNGYTTITVSEVPVDDYSDCENDDTVHPTDSQWWTDDSQAIGIALSQNDSYDMYETSDSSPTPGSYPADRVGYQSTETLSSAADMSGPSTGATTPDRSLMHVRKQRSDYFDDHESERDSDVDLVSRRRTVCRPGKGAQYVLNEVPDSTYPEGKGELVTGVNSWHGREVEV